MLKQKFYWVFAVLLCLFNSMNAQENNQPNVLFIAIDDLKPTLGSYGDALAITPNMDRLASKGATFLNNHCQQAVCAPSRVSLLTGKRPDFTKVRDLKTQMRDKNPDIVTIPQYFKSQGYITAGTGKIFDPRSVDKQVDKPSWSIPYIREHSLDYPEDYGKPVLGYYQNKEIKKEIERLFKEAESKGVKNKNVYAMKSFKPPVEISNAPDAAYTDGAIALHALELLDDVSKKDAPFFLAVGFKRPHLPFVAPKKYWDLYKRDDFKLAQYQKKAKNGTDLAYHSSGELRNYPRPDIDYTLNDEGLLDLDPEIQKELIHGYYACTSFVDTQIGLIMDSLRKKGLDKNTIIVVWGDHGWHLGDHGMWNKHSNFEQATRSPLIIYSPFIEKELSVSSPTEFVDVFPTLCDLAELPTPKNLDGRSLIPILKDEQYRVKRVAVSQWRKGKSTGYSFRSDQYRYTAWIGDNKKSDMGISENDIVDEELYDYWNDPLETTNQANNKKFDKIKNELKSYASAYFNSEKSKVNQPQTQDKDQSIGKSLKPYKKGNFRLGATLGYTQLGTDVEELFLNDFDYCTSRNFAKQSYVHPEPDVWRWDRIDKFVEFGEKNNVDLRFHGPISPQASRWAKADHRTAAELDINMTEFFTALCMRINGVTTIKWMDVVNETIERDGNWFGTKPGVKEWENPWVTIGNDENGYPKYISKAFEISNKYAPNISQVFNQHGGMEPVMWEKVKETILYLKKQGYRVDGLGWQSHLKEYSRVVDDPKNLEYLSKLIDWAHANDLDFHITEFDYHLKTGENTLDNFKEQAKAYQTILDIVLEKRNSGVVTLNFWGLVDSEDGKNKHRFLYDENRNKKPCYNAVVQSLNKGAKE